MSLFRAAVSQEIRAAATRGRSYDEILADLSTNLGWMIAAGSGDKSTRLNRVRASMHIIATILRENQR